MKLNFTKTLFIGAAMLCAMHSNAAIYTTAQSGSWTSASTWLGGTVPPGTLGANNVIISSGHTVTMDLNVVLSSTFSLLDIKGNGKLVSGGNYYLSINNGDLLSGAAASIDVDSFVYGGITVAKAATYMGTINTKGLAVNGANITLQIDVERTLVVTGQASTFVPGGGINITAGGSSTPNIIFEGGGLMLGGGIITLSNPYNVIYKDAGASVGTGFELNGAGLQDIEFDLGAGNTLNLAGDLTVSTGMLKLTTGTVKLNSFNFTIGGGATIDAAGSGTISSTTASSITISSSATDIGTLRMHFSDNTVDNFTMNTTNSSAELKLGSDLMVNTQLDLQSGKLDIQNYTLTMIGTSGATINGGSANSYIITEGGGELKQSVAGSATVLYPIGLTIAYAGANITNGGSSTLTDMGVNVGAGVMAHNTTGADLSASEPLVSATWNVSHSTTTGLDYDFEALWETALEVNSFDRAQSTVVFYTANDWERGAFGAATTSGGVNARKREGNTTTGTYSVFDNNTTGIENVAVNNAYSIYPNPASNMLNIDLNTLQGAQAEVYNTTGQVVLAAPLQSGVNSLYIADLPAGMYFLQLKGDNANGTIKFIKR